jgi:hypothetical protein
MRISRGLLLFILPLALAVPRVWSQDTKVTDASVCVFPLANLSPKDEQEHQAPLSQAVRQEFEAVGFHLLSSDMWSPEAARLKLDPDRVTEASQAIILGEKAGADMAVSGFYWKENDRILISLQCWDVKAGTLITGFLHTWRFNLGFYNSIHAEIADLVQKVVFLRAPRLITLKNDVRVDEITFTSPQNGMEVLIEGRKSVGRIENGALVFQTDGMSAGTPFMVEKRQDGYHTLQQTVIAAPQVALTPLPKANNLSLEIDWTGGQLEGAGAALRWYPKPDWIMVNFSEYLYTQIPFVPNASWPIHADTELLAGFYLVQPPEAGFRFGFSSGVGTIFTWIPATTLPIFTDVYLNLFSMWGEWKTGWGFPMFVRIELKLPMEVGYHLLRANQGPMQWGQYLPPITLGAVIPWK